MESKVIHEKAFKTKLNGYSCADVDNFMDEVADAVDQLNATIKELKDKNDELLSQSQGYRELETVLRDSIIMAQKTSAMITEEARGKARTITDTAAAQASKIVDEANAKAGALVCEATERTKEIYCGEKRLREAIESYKRQIREVMNSQLSVMEDILALNDQASAE